MWRKFVSISLVFLNFLRRTSLYILAAPLLFTALGTASNWAVLVANHDRFPVMWNDYKVNQYALEIEKVAAGDDENAALQARFDLAALRQEGFIDDVHVIMTSKTHLNFLADWIDRKTATYSPGDLLLDLGGWSSAFAPFVFAFDVIRKLRKI